MLTTRKPRNATGQTTGWVALLRGINVGGRNIVPMAELRAALESAGCGEVRTYIQSGNVLFRKRSSSRPALVRLLERTVEDAFGVAATVVVRSFEELATIAASHPFGADTSGSFVSFLAREPEPEAVARLAALDVGPDRFHLAGSDLFLLYPEGYRNARLAGPLLERTLAVSGTVRNWRAVARLAELADE